MPEQLYARLEDKVDKLTEAVHQLVRVEERQIVHAEKIEELRELFDTQRGAIEKTDRKVDQWVNRGVGVWGVTALIWTVYLAMRGGN